MAWGSFHSVLSVCCHHSRYSMAMDYTLLSLVIKTFTSDSSPQTSLKFPSETP